MRMQPASVPFHISHKRTQSAGDRKGDPSGTLLLRSGLHSQPGNSCCRPFHEQHNYPTQTPPTLEYTAFISVTNSTELILNLSQVWASLQWRGEDGRGESPTPSPSGGNRQLRRFQEQRVRRKGNNLRLGTGFKREFRFTFQSVVGTGAEKGDNHTLPPRQETLTLLLSKRSCHRPGVPVSQPFTPAPERFPMTGHPERHPHASTKTPRHETTEQQRLKALQVFSTEG